MSTNKQIKKNFVSEIDQYLLDMTKQKAVMQNPAVMNEIRKHKRLAKMRDNARPQKSE